MSCALALSLERSTSFGCRDWLAGGVMGNFGENGVGGIAR